MTVVLHVTEHLEKHGGTPRKLMYLTQHSDPARQRHCFVTFLPGDLDEDIRAAGGMVVNANSTDVTRVSRTVFDIARRERADVISTHFTRALVCGVAVSHLLRKPVIHCAHGPALEQPREGFVGRMGRVASHWSYPATRLVTANSRFTASTLKKVFGVPEDKIRIIPCPVVPRESSGIATVAGVTPRRPGALRLVQIGGLIPVRRQHVLMDALAAVVAGGIDAELLMVGDGPLGDQLKAQCRALGVDSRVHWLGFRDDVGDVLAAADMYISATDTEGFGIAVVEAMLQGLPVVLARGGAHPELIDDGRLGEMFAAGDAQDLARKVMALAADPARRAAIGEAGRAHAAQFTPRRYAEGFLRVLDEVHAP